jgi:molecular chaperone IbpA
MKTTSDYYGDFDDDRKKQYEDRKQHHVQPFQPNPHEPWGKKWKETKAQVITVNDLFPRLDRLSIGWSPLLDQLKEITNNKPSYPPYDIVALEGGDVNLLNVAVAGFTKEELTVTIQDAVLTIEGKKKDKQRGDVVYQGIATRDFKLSLAVAEFWIITNARLENGMLTIQFNKELPEEKKPKVVEIQ